MTRWHFFLSLENKVNQSPKKCQFLVVGIISENILTV